MYLVVDVPRARAVRHFEMYIVKILVGNVQMMAQKKTSNVRRGRQLI